MDVISHDLAAEADVHYARVNFRSHEEVSAFVNIDFFFLCINLMYLPIKAFENCEMHIIILQYTIETYTKSKILKWHTKCVTAKTFVVC